MLTGLMLAVLLAATPVSRPGTPGGPRPLPGPSIAAPGGACIVRSASDLKCRVTSSRRCRQLGGQFLGRGSTCPSSTDRAVTL